MSDQRRADLSKIHIAKKALGLDDATYRAVLIEVTGKKSAGMLNASERQAILQHFKDKGWKQVRPQKGKGYSPKSRDKDNKSQVDKLRALWIDMHKHGIVGNGSEQALWAFAKKFTNADRIEWMKQYELNNAIEGLKKWQLREAS